MRYDLARMVRQAGTRRRDLTLRPIVPTQALAAPLRTAGYEIVAFWQGGIRNTVLPAYEPALRQITRDEASDPIKAAIDALFDGALRLIATLNERITGWSVRVEVWHRDKWASAVQNGAGVDPRLFLTSAEAADLTRAAQQWASGLIRDLNDDMRRRVETIILKGLVEQTPRRDLAKELVEALKIGRARANLIARDQTTKLAGSLDRMRQEDAGIDRFKWRHSGKVHYRPHHLARNGNVFRWDDPKLQGDLPRQAVNCGCTGQAYIDLLDEVSED